MASLLPVRLATVSLLLAAALFAACSRTEPVTVHVAGIAVADENFTVRVTGLRPGDEVDVVVSSTDAAGVQWESATPARATDDGEVLLPEASSPTSARTALLWSMKPTRRAAAGTYLWGSEEQSFNVSVLVGDEVRARAVQRRRLAAVPVRDVALTVARDGIAGRFLSPAQTQGAGPAVLVLGGSEGGIPYDDDVAALAGRGYPTLAVAYFGVDGLRTNLASVPLEVVSRGLGWLSRQPGVDPDRMIVQGTSRGGELALLAATVFPDLVAGVVAGVPSSVVMGGFPDDKVPAWTLRGTPLPYTRERNDASPRDEPRSVIPVELIRGPVLVTCGGLDEVWSSCTYADAVVARRRAAGLRTDLVKADDGGHASAPGLPGVARADQSVRTYRMDRLAREQIWRQQLRLLRDLG